MYTVKSRKLELRCFEILAYSKLILDTLDTENRTYSCSIVITVYNIICFGCVKETSPGDVSFTRLKLMFGIIILGGYIFLYMYLTTKET